jgi:hypothetical protein
MCRPLPREGRGAGAWELRIASKDGAHGIARDSASALIRLVHDDGRVTGSFRLPLPTPADRHCTPREQLAAAWFLMMAEQQLGAIPQAGGLAERMLRHASLNAFAPFGGFDALCVLDEGLVKLEAVAFAVMALVNCSRPDLTTARRFGRFILGQRLPNGEFIHVRDYPQGRVRADRAPAATGQALLALAALYRATHEPHYFDAVGETFDALAARAYGVRQRSHWMLLAIDALDDISPDPQNVEYAAAIAEPMLAASRTDGSRETSALAATTLGLLAYLRIAARASERSRIMTEARVQVTRSLEALMTLRVPNGMFVRGQASPEVAAEDLVWAGRAFLGAASVFG